MVTLPSQRTLRDYTYYTKVEPGFAGTDAIHVLLSLTSIATMVPLLYSDDIDEQLMTIAKVQTCPEMEKYVYILVDEMHIKADLVYDKHTGVISLILIYVISLLLCRSSVGLTSIGDFNSHLVAFERSLEGEQPEVKLENSMMVVS